MKQWMDALGKVHHFENTPKRIVSLVPSQTELLYDLGLEDEIVGITKFCVHPFHLKSTKTIVGGTKQVHVEKIKGLRPVKLVSLVQHCLSGLKPILAVWTNSKNSLMLPR